MNVPFSPDFSQYDAIFGDDPPAYREFLEALERSLDKAKGGLESAAKTQDWNVISATRHSLKPTLTLLGATEIHEELDRWRPTMSSIDSSKVTDSLNDIIAAVSKKRLHLHQEGKR